MGTEIQIYQENLQDLSMTPSFEYLYHPTEERVLAKRVYTLSSLEYQTKYDNWL